MSDVDSLKILTTPQKVSLTTSGNYGPLSPDGGHI